MGAARIKGSNCLLKIAGTDYSDDCAKVFLAPEAADKDVVTFEDARAGGAVDWTFDIDSIQSTEPTAFWNYLWENAGTEGIAYVYAPHGNAVPTEAKPHFTGTLTLPAKPAIGGEAGRDKTYVFSVKLDCDGDPLKVEA